MQALCDGIRRGWKVVTEAQKFKGEVDGTEQWRDFVNGTNRGMKVCFAAEFTYEAKE